ncbi:MAG TPA: hypothetical protein VFH68_15325 [Polyangia bacterium]|nr:hypothetical protein [Polyangia bacterium]
MASVAQVATVVPFWHTSPARVHMELVHVHEAELPATVHAW